MADLPVQFATAKSRVEPTDVDKKNAQEAHIAVRVCLENDPKLKGYGIDTVLIGSYRRQVSIRRVKDVDALCKLPELAQAVTGKDILGDFERILIGEFGASCVDPQDRSIKVEFPDFDMHVDAVPARIAGNYLEIPSVKEGWQETNPERLTELTTNMNNRYDGAYLPVVKLIRQARRSNIRKRPGGFLIEVLTYHAFDLDLGLDPRCDATLFVGALRSVASQLQALADGGEVADPTRPNQTITIRSTSIQIENAASTFEGLAKKAEDALADADRCSAAKKFREILGKNADDEWVFEMPAGCDEEGVALKASVVRAGDRQVPAGDGRFA